MGLFRYGISSGCIVHTWAHCSPLVSNVPSLGEFPGYCDWLRYPGLYPLCWCPSPFPFAFHLGVFIFTLHLPLNFIRVSSLRPTYLHPCDRPLTCWCWASRLGTGSSVPDVVVPEAEHGVRKKHKSRFKFLPWPEFEPQTSQSKGRERYH